MKSTTLYPYIKFNKNCIDAIFFYESIFSAVSSHRQTYGEVPLFADKVSEADKNCIMHCELDFDGVKIMICDDLQATNEIWNVGKYERINIGITFEKVERQEEIFSNLAKEGTILMPLSETNWNAKFGIVMDKFGITWLLNHNY